MEISILTVILQWVAVFFGGFVVLQNTFVMLTCIVHGGSISFGVTGLILAAFCVLYLHYYGFPWSPTGLSL